MWVFFGGSVPAASARRIGVHLLREAMTVRAELDLASYDRLFPTQDFMPKGSFGNLIALPLQGECRKRGTTVFLDPTTLEPYEDQWAFLASLDRLRPDAVAAMTEAFGELATGPEAATYRKTRISGGPEPPPEIAARMGAMLAIDRIGVPPALLAALKHAASIHNPEFYEKERMRLSTWNVPRFIRCYRETLDQLLLPRGLYDKARALAFPIKFKGNVVQYVGRVLRPTDTKLRVEVHDYVDSLVPVLARQHDERRAAYATLGFDVPRLRPHRPGRGRTRPDTLGGGDRPDG